MTKWLAVVVLVGLVCGCTSKGEREAKREQDRATMQLADVQRQRDELRVQNEQLRSQAQTQQASTAALQKRADDLQQQNAKLIAEMEAMRNQVNKPQVAAPATRPTNMNK